MGHRKEGQNRSKTGEAYLKRGDMYNRQREPTKAKADFLQALGIDADDADAHNNLGKIYMVLEEFEQAVSHFEKALALNPKISGVYYKLSSTYINMERFEEAVEIGTAALTSEWEEEKEKVHYALGRAYIGLGAYEKALHHFQQARDLGIEVVVDIDYFIGQTYSILSEPELAFEYLQKSLARDPKRSAVHSSIALLHMKQGQLEEAEKYLVDALFLNPNCKPTHTILEMFEENRKAQKQEGNT